MPEYQDRIQDIIDQNQLLHERMQKLEMRKEELPERLHPTIDQAIENLSVQETESLEGFLTEEDTREYVAEASSQLRSEVSVIEDLHEQELLTDEQRVNEIQRIMNHEDYTDLLAILTTAQSTLEENPYEVEVLLGIAVGQEEDKSESEPDSDNGNPQTNGELKKPRVSGKRHEPHQEEKEEKVAAEPQSETEPELEIIEVQYSGGNNTVFVNGAPIEGVTYRATTQKRLALVRTVASLERDEVFTSAEALYQRAHDETGVEINHTNKDIYRWVSEFVVGEDGESVLQRTGERGSGSRYWRHPHKTAHVTGEVVVQHELRDDEATGETTSHPVEGRVVIEADAEPDTPDETEVHTENFSVAPSEETNEAALEALTDAVKSYVITTLKQLRDVQHFKRLGNFEEIEILFESVDISAIENIQSVKDLATELAVGALTQSDEFFDLWEQLHKEELTTQVQNNILFLEWLDENLSELQGFITPALIQTAAQEVDENMRELLVESPEERVIAHGITIDEAKSFIQEAYEAISSLGGGKGRIKLAQAAASIGVGVGDIVTARDANLIPGNNTASRKQGQSTISHRELLIAAMNSHLRGALSERSVLRLVTGIIDETMEQIDSKLHSKAIRR